MAGGGAETELKITLDAREMSRLRRHPALAALRVAPRATQRLVSVYLDAEDHRLAAAGMSLRLRRVGRRWVQTIKSGKRGGGVGFFSHAEVETPAPGGRVTLTGPDPSGAFAAVTEALAGEALRPVFETRVARVVERLRLAQGLVELALDTGEVVAGEARAPIVEAELELVEGEVGAIFALARQLFPLGPVRFSSANKAALGYRLAREGVAQDEAKARGAGKLGFAPEATMESVARDVFRDCFAQVAANAALVARSDAVEGPHQLRVGLRRLRTAFGVFGESLGEAAVAPLSAEARDLGQVVGALRDADVLVTDVVGGAARFGLDDAAHAALVAALDQRRRAVRAEVRAKLAGAETTAFLFDLLEFIETRGWLAPSDYSQTARLAAPVAEAAPALLAARQARVHKKGRKIAKLDDEGLHELRKELKKLRYTVETFAPIHGGKRFDAYLRALKEMQETFGSLNDAAMAVEALAGPEAPARDDPAAQRAAGFVLGALAVQVGRDRPELFGRWKEFSKTKPFWS